MIHLLQLLNIVLFLNDVSICVTTFTVKFATGNDEHCLAYHKEPCKTFSALFQILDDKSEVVIFPENVTEGVVPFSWDTAKASIKFSQTSDKSSICASPTETKPFLTISNVNLIKFQKCNFYASISPILEISHGSQVSFFACTFLGGGGEKKGSGPLVKVFDFDEFYVYFSDERTKTILTTFGERTIDGQGAGLYIDKIKKSYITGSNFTFLTATQGSGLFVGKDVESLSLENLTVSNTKAIGEQDNGGGAGIYISSVSTELEAKEKAVKFSLCNFTDCDSGTGTGMERGFGGCVYTGRSITCRECTMKNSHGRRGSCISANGRGLKEGQECLIQACHFEGMWNSNAKDEAAAEVLLHVLAFEVLNVSIYDRAPNHFMNQASSLTTAGIFCADVDKIYISFSVFENCFGSDGGCITAEPVADWQNEMSLMEILDCEMKGNEEFGKHSQKGEPSKSGAMIYAKNVKNVTISMKDEDKKMIISSHTSLVNERSGGIVIEDADLLLLNNTKLDTLNGISGGAIFLKQNIKSVELIDVTIEHCTSIQRDKNDLSGRGGAIFISDFVPKFASNFVNLADTSYSHGSFANDPSTTINITGCHINYCSATEGAAIFIETCKSDGAQRKKLSISYSDFSRNKASSDGGAIMIREKKNRSQTNEEDVYFENSTAQQMNKRMRNEVNYLHSITNSKFSFNECKAKIQNVAVNSNNWPITPCGSAISIIGAEDLAGSASNEQIEYLLLSSSTSYKNNTHSAFYAKKGAKVKSDGDTFENNIEKDKNNMDVLIDITCEKSKVIVTNPKKGNPQRLCDESCSKLSTSESSALKCEFTPSEDITPNYTTVVIQKGSKLPVIEFKGNGLYPLHTPILWIGKSERTNENSKDGITAELDSKKESDSSSQYVFSSKGEIDLSKLGASLPSTLFLHISVDDGESWSKGMQISIKTESEKEKKSFPGYGIALIVIVCVVAISTVAVIAIVYVLRKRKNGYKSFSK
ncbi:uncharacterized protein MONOS_4744 [Monocercomonoides exilis]|uniref:uncharacterized protein n=1 Tax=Monocercomonoides exilis TaxID=2049356 RepID=UPI00355AB691|nr:hypothetical protein MONOS_4744 [Monocercomonoides exilis]|eukprot:MONOS_4744.1-p1 / transcript=MONOS_4744.1 / gene=MONOS_4744 / organism=Monocercomonoides_exilis_PA203 / gene_product=unspecified product / transcript_product=unspecified product / location=Mono_scaffold00130:57048-60099(-) / protein_length=986 / sequence_SO=supercontig / SO=protein_coding / is_pseudo=false